MIVLVDAVTFTEHLRDSPAFFTSQVSQADVLLLNKTDLVEPGRVHALQATLETMAPGRGSSPPSRSHRRPRRAAGSAPAGDPGDAEVLTRVWSRSASRSPASRRARALVENCSRPSARGRTGGSSGRRASCESVDGWLRFDLASGLVDVVPGARSPGAVWSSSAQVYAPQRVPVDSRAVDRTAERTHHKGGSWTGTV